MSVGHILVVDDEPGMRRYLQTVLELDSYRVTTAADGLEALQKLQRDQPDVVLLDMVMPGPDGLETLKRIRESRPTTKVVMLSCVRDTRKVAMAMRLGAQDYLSKPVQKEEMDDVLHFCLDHPSPSAPGAAEVLEVVQGVFFFAATEQMRQIRAQALQVARFDFPVLILGESGTGKELVARALHDYGKRRNGPFVAINMAAIPRDLIESELFGHEKGAFTGANTRSSGRFEQAEGGTLFLDEIGDMPMEAQTRLLRVLQQGEYTTVGGRTPIKADVRIIAATNKDLRQLIQQGLFREDLFFRLNVVPLRLPPLRERSEDIPDLIRHFFALVEREGLPPKQIDQAALDRLKRHRWPGNVRELENLARRLAALYPQETITAAVIDAELSQPALAAPGESRGSDENLSNAVERYLARYFAGFDGDLPPPGLYHRILREVEGPLVSAALAATRGNQIRAADLLGVNRNTLRKKIRELEIQVIRSS